MNSSGDLGTASNYFQEIYEKQPPGWPGKGTESIGPAMDHSYERQQQVVGNCM